MVSLARLHRRKSRCTGFMISPTYPLVWITPGYASSTILNITDFAGFTDTAQSVHHLASAQRCHRGLKSEFIVYEQSPHFYRRRFGAALAEHDYRFRILWRRERHALCVSGFTANSLRDGHQPGGDVPRSRGTGHYDRLGIPGRQLLRGSDRFGHIRASRWRDRNLQPYFDRDWANQHSHTDGERIGSPPNFLSRRDRKLGRDKLGDRLPHDHHGSANALVFSHSGNDILRAATGWIVYRQFHGDGREWL